METWRDTTFLSTDQGIYKSWDNGATWSKISTSTGVLGHSHVYGDTMTLNTIYLILGNGGTRGSLGFNLKKPDIGAIMDSGIIMVRDGGRLFLSIDGGASYYAFSLDGGKDMKNFLALTGDTGLVVYAHALWKVKDIVTGVQVTLPTTAMLTGALCEDSTGAIYTGLTDGSLLVSHDRASTWQTFSSPAIAPNTIVTALTAGRPGMLWAVTKDTTTQRSSAFYFDPSAKIWTDITSSLMLTDSTMISNVWYVNGYAYAGTSNMGLFRSVKSSYASVRSDEVSRISMIPNPVSRTLVVTYEAGQEGAISILDVTGREVLRNILHPDASQTMLDVSALPAGMYVMRMTTPKTREALKFVKE
jgi:hypothetical protein